MGKLSCKFESKCPISAGKCNGENFEKCVEWLIDTYNVVRKHHPQVLYECDKRACVNCKRGECHHTADVRHAKNFELFGDAFVEVKE